MNRKQLKQAAKKKLAHHWKWAALTMLASTLIIWIVTGSVFGSFIFFWLTSGINLAFLHLVDNRKDKNAFDAVLAGFTQGRAIPIFLTNLLCQVFLTLWGLLLFIPGIIKAYAYAMTDYIVDDLTRQGKDITPTEAITKSRQLMFGHKWELFILDLSFLGWAILCLFTLGIGFYWLTPYRKTTRAEFYRALLTQNPAILVD